MIATIEPIEVPNLHKRVNRVTVDFYHLLGESGLVKKRTELIRGVIINKMSKSPLHSTVLAVLEDIMRERAPSSHIVRRDDPLTLADSEPEPDIAVVRGNRKDYASGHPTTADLVVEVAVTSLADDRDLAALYAEAGVKEYWIVIAMEKQIEVYRTPVAGVYQDKGLYKLGEIIDCASLPGVKLKLDELFAAVP